MAENVLLANDPLLHEREKEHIQSKRGFENAKRQHSIDDTNVPTTAQKPPFKPNEKPKIQISLPDELWLAILDCPCTFPAELFNSVMLNLVKNPNITSSHLFRADIFYDSEKDLKQELLKHLSKDYLPRKAEWPGFELERTIVRQLVPRNPQLDRHLLQTCHFFQHRDGVKERNLVVYIPHVDRLEDMPFYHPFVSQLAFLHTRNSTDSSSLTLLYRPFATQPTLDPKLHRTALKLLQTIHKHGQGQLLGYQKRVHHDKIIPQDLYQNTYTRLKTKYGRELSEQWVEVTDPGKHVFEDIGIAAFLIELWAQTYRRPDEEEDSSKPLFPGFVDIGCGNGILVYILLEEGYDGFGFDARKRKTWEIFPEFVQERLKQQVLIPAVLQNHGSRDERWHNGLFKPGTFIVSNHADELTTWTPLLAYMNHSAFIAIPCCSHDLSGARFRAPATTKSPKENKSERFPQHVKGKTSSQAAETGSLKRTEAQKKMPSAYSTLCSYVSSLAEEVNFKPEQDVLRIPSTRNSCIVGRNRIGDPSEIQSRMIKITEIVERELRRDIDSVAEEWIERAERLMKKPGSGH